MGQILPAWPGFACGLAGWAFILFEIFLGEAGGSVGACSEAVATSFNNMRMIVTVGWAIYPAGYLFGYLLGAVDETVLNVSTTSRTLSTRSLSSSPAGLLPRPSLRA